MHLIGPARNIERIGGLIENERGRQAKRLHGEGDVVVLRQSDGVEHLAPTPGLQSFDRFPAEAGGHAGAWNNACKTLPDKQILIMKLREFIHIGARGHLKERAPKGVYRDLDEIEGRDERAEQRKFSG